MSDDVTTGTYRRHAFACARVEPFVRQRTHLRGFNFHEPHSASSDPYAAPQHPAALRQGAWAPMRIEQRLRAQRRGGCPTTRSSRTISPHTPATTSSFPPTRRTCLRPRGRPAGRGHDLSRTDPKQQENIVMLPELDAIRWDGASMGRRTERRTVPRLTLGSLDGFSPPRKQWNLGRRPSAQQGSAPRSRRRPERILTSKPAAAVRHLSDAQIPRG